MHSAARCSIGPGAGGQLLHRLTQVFVRIDWRIADAHLVMQMRAGAAAAGADVSDHLAACHLLAIEMPTESDASLCCFVSFIYGRLRVACMRFEPLDTAVCSVSFWQACVVQKQYPCSIQ